MSLENTSTQGYELSRRLCGIENIGVDIYLAGIKELSPVPIGDNFKYDEIAKHMPADGSAWITNNLKYHNAFNGGEENRVHLVACVLDYKFN